jgi:uncharacterized LabA/DUF88 family protein
MSFHDGVSLVPFKETVRVVQSGQRRIKIFVDFWNVVINARSQTKFNVDIKWDLLVDSIVAQTRQDFGDKTNGELAGCYIFGSVSSSDPVQTKEIDRVLDQYGSKSGLFFNFAERVSKQTSIKCSECKQPVKIRSESGVDVMLTVEMIKHSVMREHEYLAIVSSDRDFIPLLSYLRDQGQRVLHVSAGKADRDMRSLTWAQIDLSDDYPSICSIQHDGYILLTAPPYEAQVKEIIDASPVPHESIQIIDVTDRNQISDKDLIFIMKNQNMYWKDKASENSNFHQINHYSNINSFRASVSSGLLYGHIPHLILNGNCFAHFNEDSADYPWVQHCGQLTDANGHDDWQQLFARKEPRGETNDRV